MPYHFRPYTPDDLNFIMNSWGRSYYEGSDYFKWLSPRSFHYYHRPIRLSILNKPNMAAIVCASNNDPTLILGWIVVETPYEERGLILHYIYVKEAFKREGIGTELFNRAIVSKPVLFTHLTEKASKILIHKNKDKMRYIPHLI